MTGRFYKRDSPEVYEKAIDYINAGVEVSPNFRVIPESPSQLAVAVNASLSSIYYWAGNDRPISSTASALEEITGNTARASGLVISTVPLVHDAVNAERDAALTRIDSVTSVLPEMSRGELRTVYRAVSQQLGHYNPIGS